MEKKTLKALKGSIQKWKKIVKGTGVDKGYVNCPLCQLFYKEENLIGKLCLGCPVMEKTGHPNCQKTPYVDYIKFGFEYTDSDSPDSLKYAKKELKFLESLLPKEKKQKTLRA